MVYSLNHFKALMGMDHTVLPAINTMPAVYLVSVHQMTPPPIEVANI